MIDLNKEKEFISKKAILEHIQDSDIYHKYFYGEIEVGGKPQLSPFRKENHPSFGFFMGESNEICFKDFKLDVKGDCIKFVQIKYGLTYFEALSKIAIDFGIEEGYKYKKFEKTEGDTTKKYPTREEVLSKVTAFKIGKNKRNWLAHDILYWQQFGISINTLEFFNVEPIKMLFINDNPYVADKYAYCFTEYKDGRTTYKIYQPYNEKYKWINGHNDSVWQGWEQLPAVGQDLVITKSLKDVMTLYEVCKLPAVALQSENILPKLHVFEQLKSRFQDITLLYDNDFDAEINWGKQFGDKLSSHLGVVECYIPDKYESKDPSDLVKNIGVEKAREIILKETLIPF
ncbi:MAG TPA: hypothetical protein VF680_17145 [Allosphingosinicella sp.]|jgi:hypothetical protein